MKIFILSILVLSISSAPFAQSKKLLQRSWVRYEVQNLSAKETAPDTLYTRYTFDKSSLYISFYPGWDDYKVNWNLKKNGLAINFDTYRIEELTDSSLTIALDGFRRVRFWAEDYLCQQDKYLILLDSFNNKPLYKATNYITPRYAKHISLQTVLQKNLEGHNIKKAAYFMATFIVNDKGSIENVRVVNSINQEFDNDVIQLIKKTSGSWIPANFKGMPIQTQTFYDIKYLKSLTRFNTETLN
jgi:hypothetical protein